MEDEGKVEEKRVKAFKGFSNAQRERERDLFLGS